MAIRRRKRLFGIRRRIGGSSRGPSGGAPITRPTLGGGRGSRPGEGRSPASRPASWSLGRYDGGRGVVPVPIRLAVAGRVGERGEARVRRVGRALEHGMTPRLVLLTLLLGAAVWLATTGFLVAWWLGGALGGGGGGRPAVLDDGRVRPGDSPTTARLGRRSRPCSPPCGGPLATGRQSRAS